MANESYPAHPTISRDAHTGYHVVHILGSLQTGGAEMALVNYLRAADRRLFHHSVLCLSREGDMVDKVRELGIPVIHFKVRMRFFPADLIRLGVWLRKEKAVIVHTHMFYAAMWGRLAGLIAGVPVLVTTEHGKEPWKKKWHIAVDRWLGARTYRQIAVSEDVRRIRIQRDSAPSQRVLVIPNGVPIPTDVHDDEARQRIRQEFGLCREQPVIGSVGRMVNAKAYTDLAKAMVQLRGMFPEIHWLQVGDGPDRASLVTAVKELGLEGAVTMVGRRDDISDLLQAMDVWVMSSIREGLPVALLEAMAAGRAIVATNVGGIPDAVEDKISACLVPASDPEALAQGVAMVLSDDGLKARLAKNAYTRVAEVYGNRSVAEKIEQVYRSGLAAEN